MTGDISKDMHKASVNKAINSGAMPRPCYPRYAR